MDLCFFYRNLGKISFLYKKYFKYKYICFFKKHKIMIYQNTTELLNDLYEFALRDTKSILKVVDIGEVDEELAQIIAEKTGIDVLHFKISIDTFSIKHIMKQHGNPFTETQRGQIAIKKSDFLLIGDIISEAEYIEEDKRISKKTNQIIHQSLIFRKTYEIEHVVIKEIRQVIKKGKVNRIVLQSMRKHVKPKKNK